MQEFSLISELMFRSGKDGVDEAYRTLVVKAQEEKDRDANTSDDDSVRS